MARRIKTATLVTFEKEEEARELIGKLAEMNSVEKRIQVQGCCGPLDLRNYLREARSEKCLIVMDVEGAELSLLQPALIGALRHCDILVELHDFVTPGLSAEIKSRFENTHLIEQIWARDRTAKDLPFHASAYGWYMCEALREFRPRGMSWFYMRKRES
jgi:hypothetical protein